MVVGCVDDQPVNTEYDEHEGGEDVSAGPDHHQNLASHVPSVPLKHHHHRHHNYQNQNLYHDPPDGLHGHGDEGDDGVSEGEMENQKVDVCSTDQVHPADFKLDKDIFNLDKYNVQIQQIYFAISESGWKTGK